GDQKCIGIRLQHCVERRSPAVERRDPVEISLGDSPGGETPSPHGFLQLSDCDLVERDRPAVRSCRSWGTGTGQGGTGRGQRNGLQEAATRAGIREVVWKWSPARVKERDQLRKDRSHGTLLSGG